MDPEEHDELKDNDLASWLQFGLWNFLKENGSYILLALALCFLGYQLWSLHRQRQLQELWSAWADLHAVEQSQQPDKQVSDMLEVIDKHKQKPVQAQAYLWLGNTYDLQTMSPAWLDAQRMTRDDSLDKSHDAYQAALDAQPNDPLVAGYAHLGLAAVDEDRGDWDKARAEYTLLTNPSSPFANTPIATIAQTRLSNLDDRKNSPRLAALIPPPQPTTPSPLPSLSPGSGSGSSFPGLFPNTFGPSATGSPVLAPPQTSPAGPAPSNPFGIPLFTPPASSQPSTAPSSSPSSSNLPSFLNVTPTAGPAPAPPAAAPTTAPATSP